MDNKPTIIKLETPKGWGMSLKNALFGQRDIYDIVGTSGAQEQPLSTDTYRNNSYHFFLSNHNFSRGNLRALVETGYTNNPIVFSIIQKILLCQRNIIFTPWWDGKQYKKHKFKFDIFFATQNFLTTGTLFLYKREVVGFPDKLEVFNTLDINESYQMGQYVYELDLHNGYWEKLDNDKLIIIKFADPSCSWQTQFGLSPLFAAQMPVEALRHMYISDVSALKNKGADIMISNGSDLPLKPGEEGTFDEVMNKRIAGSHRTGRAVTTTARVEVHQLGRTAKELQLWDGSKIKTREICNVFQVDSGQFNDPDNKRFSNVQESNRSLYNDCVIPFTKYILNDPRVIEALGYEVFLDVSGIDCLQEAQKDRADKAKITTDAIIMLNENVRSGVITADIAVSILVNDWGYDQAEAEQVINRPVGSPPAKPVVTVDNEEGEGDNEQVNEDLEDVAPEGMQPA